MKKVVPFSSSGISSRADASSIKSQAPSPAPTAEAVSDAVRGWSDDAEQQLLLMQRVVGCTEALQLLAHFFSWCSDFSLADGMRYRSEDGNDEHVFGNQRHHSATYTLTLDGTDLGAVTLCRRERYSEQELLNLEQALGALARCLRTAAAFSELQALVTQDPLTGLGNRTSLHQAIDRELSRAQRYGYDRPLSVMMVDIDHFKRFNDRLGHLGGDRALKTIANVLRRSTRGSDLLFRYGGDEFTILLPHTDCSRAEDAAHQIRANLARIYESECGLDAAMKDLQLDVSIGISSYRPGDTEDSLLQRADTNLYHAKADGRGTVCSSV